MILERDDVDEAGVAQDLLKSPGLRKENCLAHRPLGGKNANNLGVLFLIFRTFFSIKMLMNVLLFFSYDLRLF